MKFKRQSSETLELNLAPLIDVVFLLLIFFMVSTTFKHETELKIDLPESNGEPAKVEIKQIEVVIGSAGEYLVNERKLLNNQKDTLKRAILDAAGSDCGLPFIITADAKTPHEYVVRAMDIAGQLGFSRLSITTRREGTR